MKLDIINQIIFIVRGNRVILDFHLARLYGVSTKVLKQAVRRIIERFPDDFMIELTRDEVKSLNENERSQFVTIDWLSITYNPFAFIEQGVAMLSIVLRSDRGIKMNIEIIRMFVFLRKTPEQMYNQAQIKIRSYKKTNRTREKLDTVS